MNSMYYVGRKHERQSIKKELNQLVEEKKKKSEIIDAIRKL